MRRLLYTLGLLLVLHLLAMAFEVTYVYKALWYNLADISDNEIFENRVVEAGEPQTIPRTASNLELPAELNDLLHELGTIGLVVVRRDTIVHESYHHGYSDTSQTNVFSMAKSIVGLLVGAAIDEGKIKSLDQPVADFLPEFRDGDMQKVTIRHLLNMSSGLNWEESYISPFSHTTEAYYGSDLRKLIGVLRPAKEPGTEFRYKSGDSQLLSFVIKEATGKTLAEYASEKLWKPLGAKSKASWSLDREGGNEKAYCCFNSNAHDLARVGMLLLNEGQFNGKQIISKDYMRAMTSPINIPNEYGRNVSYYGRQIWIVQDRPGVYYARGILGQYIIVVPDQELVIVRLGEHRGKRQSYHFEEVYALVDGVSQSFR